ncbi:MAG: DUF1559 domain-containing protein [Planctomycetaceae bacterium]|nr:DUF1559 domain-containing protein [Planctomycetaceae bacterium]
MSPDKLCIHWRAVGSVFKLRIVEVVSRLVVLAMIALSQASTLAQTAEADRDGNQASPAIDSQKSLQTPWRNAVPEAPLGFVGWNGWSTSPRNLENNAQAILSEPEVERFIQEVIRRIGGIPRQAMSQAPPAQRRAASRLATNVLESFVLRSGCFYLESFVPPRGGQPPKIAGCVWLELGPQANAIWDDLNTVLADAPTEIGEQEVKGRKFLTMDVTLGPETLLFVGVVDECLMISIGERSLVDSLDRLAEGNSPSWLQEAEKKHGLAQLQGLGKFDFAKLWGEMLPALLEMGMGDQELGLIRSLGLDRLQSIETVDGFAERHRVQRIQVNVSAGSGGIWSVLEGSGLAPDSLQFLTTDTLYSYSIALDLGQTLRYVEQVINQVDGSGANPISGFYEGLYQETGVDLEKDIFGALGKVWTIHNAAQDGWLSGLALSVSIDEPTDFQRGLEKFINAYVQATSQDPEMPKVDSREHGELKVFTLSFPSGPIPVLPSWTVHKDRLIVTLFPDTLPGVVQVPDQPLLTSSPEIRQVFESKLDSESILMVSYVDMQRQFEMLYPYAQMMLAMGSNALQGLPSAEAESFGEVMDGLTLPTSRVIHRHLLPTVSILKRNEAGLLLESRTTFPTADVTVMAPVAVGLLLPAVQQARDAARRTQSQNNLFQIVLALHNFHDTFGKFPAAYSQSEDKQPLLSWRVHILPFIEQQELYDRFRLDEPWDSPHNLALLEFMPPTFRGPNSQAPPDHTVYLGVTGDNAALALPTRTGKASASAGIGFAQIVDGSSNTAIGLEVSDELAVPWTKPDADIKLDDFDSSMFYGQYPGGVVTARADGSVEFVRVMSDDFWKIFFQINDGNVSPMLESGR